LVRCDQIQAQDRQRIDLFLKQSDYGLCRAMIELGIIQERALAESLSAALDLPIATVDQYPDSIVLGRGISVEFLKRHGAMPLALEGEAVQLAVTDPFDGSVVKSFRLLTGKPVSLSIAIPSDLDAALERLTQAAGNNDRDRQGPDQSILTDSDTQRLKDLASEAPIIRLVDLLIARAVEVNASDIHIETYEHRLRIRYRLDGMLQDVEAPPIGMAAPICSRLKILSRLDIAERRLPQDGRFKHPVRGKMVDFRVSIVPTLHGEKIVLRILDRSTAPISLPTIGFSARTLTALEMVLARPHGMFLATGPTGSGKTTTLYAGLRSLPATTRNIMTIEDPVEYQLDGINQIQVRPQIGLDFATILRSVLRQDPDIIMVGEIRDTATAELAVHAALTGHLVLSTLHTNSAVGAFARLVDMGVADFLVASAVEGVMAQRLVRRLCQTCREPQILPASLMEKSILGELDCSSQSVIYRAKGCPACNGTGYRGRLAVSEILIPDEEFRRRMLARSSMKELQTFVTGEKFRSLWQDGIAKVLEGETSLEEIGSQLATTGN
jgi:general secretion pathway protein E